MSRTIGHRKDRRSTKKKQKEFLQRLEECCSVTVAAKKAKVPRSTVYQWREDDKDFYAAFEKSCNIAVGVLEDEAIRRAHQGVVRPIFQGGKKVGSVREYSDALLIKLLQARDPDKYKDRISKEITGKGGGPIEMNHSITHNVNFKKCDKEPSGPAKEKSEE